MNCPSCNRPATSFLRNIFSLQGVSVLQSFKGFLKCGNCGALLRVNAYGKQFWFFVIGSVAVLSIFTMVYRVLILLTGNDVVTVIWILIVLSLAAVFAHVQVRYAQVTLVDDGLSKKSVPLV